MNVYGCHKIQMFNSLHLVHIIAFLLEEALPVGDKNGNKITFSVCG